MTEPVIVDTNLLILLTAGRASVEIIGKHKKTRAFTTGDFTLLMDMIGRSPIVVLPNIATEASNLLSFHSDAEKAKLLMTFRALVDVAEDVVVPSKIAAAEPEITRLGITDCAILHAARGRKILTTDAVLYVSAVRRGLDVTNFHHVKDGVPRG